MKNKTEQTFYFRAPGALRVQLVGDFTHWQKSPVNMKKDAQGVWKATVPLDPGTYHYRILVDGEWRDDPESTVRVPNPFGSENNVRVVK
jgi:1,4-alpha-glucan branching enzyme